MAKVYVKSYGCTLNYVDGDAMVSMLKQKHSLVDSIDEADVVVLNTCAVKDSTEKKELYLIQRINKPLVVAGCLTYNKELIWKVNPNATLLSAQSRDRIVEAVEEALKGNATFISSPAKKQLFYGEHGAIARIAIQEGCTMRCTYCATKLARPKLMSYRPKEIIEAINATKAVEIQLTGMDTGAYGLDIGTDLVKLLKSIANSPRRDEIKVRVGMINPFHIKRLKGYFDVFSANYLYKFFHIPVQSGSNRILRLMRRGYTREEFLSMAKEAKKRGLLATDIIVGFPGESEEDFEQTLKLIEESKPSVVNISKFSPRPLTEAYNMKWLEPNIVKERTKLLYEMLKEMHLKENEQFIGKALKVLTTERAKGGVKGRTDEYRQVFIRNYDRLSSRVEVEIKEATHTTLIGEVIS